MLDATDFKILNHLQNDGRLSNQELADKIALSPSSCLRRVKALEQQGYIERYQAVLCAAKLGFGVEAFVEVGIAQTKASWHEHFIASVEHLNEIAAAYIITGSANYLLHIRARDFAHFSHFIIHTLNKIDGVRDIKSNIVMQSLKQNDLKLHV